MKIKLKPIVINSEDPFQNDSLDRKQSAEILTEFVSSLDEPYVIALDSEWGTGKTTFLKMWQAYLNNHGFQSLYFNAWETDYNDDPLIALIKEIELNNGPIGEEVRSKKAKKYLEKAKKAGTMILKKGIPAAIKIGTYGLLDASKVTEDAIASLTEEIAKEKFEEYEKLKKSLQHFRDNLELFAEEVVANCEGPLVFIIDELDRCRPSYAIQLMERLKHFFSIKNIVFVLGIDKKQMGFSIETLYGQGLDVSGYLSRFIDLDYKLPMPDKKVFIESILARHELENFFESRSKYTNLKDDKISILTSFTNLLDRFDISLRHIEQIISQLVVVIRFTKENEHIHAELLCFLLILRKHKYDLYEKLINNKISATLLFQDLGISTFPDIMFIYILRAYIELSHGHVKGTSDKLFDKYKSKLESLSSSDDQKKEARIMIELIQYVNRTHHGDVIGFLSKKIEIAHRFE